jgi:hypothetical protein
MLPTIALCLTLAAVPGVVDEDASCVPIYRVSDATLRTLYQMDMRGEPPDLWSYAAEDEMNRRSDDGHAPAR